LNHLPFSEGVRVDVTVSPANTGEAGWPPDYFAKTFGAIADGAFVRHPQGDFESREPLG
jgi:hypothetical protein